ncbi:phage portal protein, partial [Pseudomonas aeruginosa]|uniref:phage portal protein n=1 Tax=Pseudomonas aeruginosa TaxID=287 RepID=UPI00209508A0
MSTLNAARPNANFAGFEGAMLRNAAAAIGISYEQLTQDWSQTNYSSARAALVEVWRTLSRRRMDFGIGFCTPIYATFLEEAFELGELPLPAGAPDFIEARAEYARAQWIGPGRGWVDPVKEPTGSMI